MASTIFTCTIAVAVVFGLALSFPYDGHAATYAGKDNNTINVTGDACKVYSAFVDKFRTQCGRTADCWGHTGDNKTNITTTCRGSTKNITNNCSGTVTFNKTRVLNNWSCNHTIYSNKTKDYTHCLEVSGNGKCSRGSSSILSPLSALALTLIAFIVHALH